ncbi:MAG: PIN domain-containing protein [Holophagales bacterium]|jgi:predicted nucleic acid-binding protein|nr:PIN domain-containing protein [Holophagales bacterium]
MTYALDSNIVSHVLKRDAPVLANYRKAMDDAIDIVIPPIVCYEVLRGLLARGMTKRLAEFDELRQSALQVEFDVMVWQKAAQIYASLFQHGRPIDEGDYLIAAYCIVNDFTLVTNNTRHFEHVDGLKTVNWK